MNNLEFKNEMLLPQINGEIYYSLFELENWYRRICLAACMIRYGSEWPSKIAPNVTSAVRRRLQRNRDIFYLGAETDDNIIWATMHGELRTLLLDDELWPTIERLTHLNKDRFTSKLHELTDIRNLIAHNRAFSSQTETIFRGLYQALSFGIERFKDNILYSNIDVLDEYDTDALNVHFQKELEENDWSKFQAFIAKHEFFYNLVCLPVQRHGSFVSASKLLKYYMNFLPDILAFTVNKSGDEYSVLIPRNIALAQGESLLSLFAANGDIWTTKSYTDQNPKYICNPKIWFYENRRPVEE